MFLNSAKLGEVRHAGRQPWILAHPRTYVEAWHSAFGSRIEFSGDCRGDSRGKAQGRGDRCSDLERGGCRWPEDGAELGFPCEAFVSKGRKREEHDADVIACLRAHGVELACLAGTCASCHRSLLRLFLIAF